MYSVGENPVYAKRLKQRQSRKEGRAKVAAAEEEQRRARLIGGMFDGVEGEQGMSEEWVEAQAPLAEYCEGAIPSGVLPGVDAADIPRGGKEPMDGSSGLGSAPAPAATAWAADGGEEEPASVQRQAADAGGRPPLDTYAGLDVLLDESSVWKSLFAEENAVAEEEALEAGFGWGIDTGVGSAKEIGRGADTRGGRH